MLDRIPALLITLSAICLALPNEASAESRPAARRSAIERDWMLQDYMSIDLPDRLEREKILWREEHLKAPESRPDAPVLEKLTCFVSNDHSIVERRMVARVIGELDAAARPLREQLDQLADDEVPGSDPRWKRLYLAACEQRREKRLQPLLARWNRFVFNQHHPIPNTWKYTEGLSCAQSYRFFKPGASIDVLEMNGAYGTVSTLLSDPGGMLRNPDISFDGKRLLFAWKKSDRGDDYHQYEMDLETGAIRQLTDGLGVADFEGIYLPDGNILFSSTRCVQTVDCNWTEVSNLYVMDGDGRFMRRLGFDQVHTVFPTLGDDGRVFYTRWDYNDRGQIYTQPLFQMNPDGTNQREFYGGNSWFPTNVVHARKIPGSRELVAIVTGHHTGAHGKLAILDPGLGRQEAGGVQLIAPVRETKPIRVDKYGLGGNHFQHPWPIDGEHFLVTLSLPRPDGEMGPFHIYTIDRDGRRELLVEGSGGIDGIGCKQLVPLAARTKPHLRPSTVDYRKTDGTFYVQDVYEGLGLQGVPRGSIKRLRVVALKFRASGIGKTKQDGPGGFSNVSTPIAVGNGSWDVKVVLGSARVFEDGSVFFKAPARTPVYFQALDDKGRAVQTMRSWATLMPGENQSCVGCHEHKNSVPRSGLGMSLAMTAGPQQLQPFYGPPRGFSFAAEIQPIIDRHCVECHTGDEDQAFSLASRAINMPEMGRRLSEAYVVLTNTRGSNGDPNHAMVNWIDSMSGPGPLPPYHRGSTTSRMMELLEEGHEDVELSAEEYEKLACWIDLLVPYCGDYLEANTWSETDRDSYAHYAAKRERMLEAESEAIEALIDRQRGVK